MERTISLSRLSLIEGIVTPYWNIALTDSDNLEELTTYFIETDFFVQERFKRGRPDCCRIMSFRNGAVFDIQYYDDARVDSLKSRQLVDGQLIEIFIDRNDGLVRRATQFPNKELNCDAIIAINEEFTATFGIKLPH